MEDDPEKVNDILDTLNTGLANDEWEEAEGYAALINVDGPVEKPNFDPSQGIIVKVFVNTRTGEIKTYHFRNVVQS
jgi:hypothetical protein